MIRKKELWAFLLTSRLPPSLLFSVKQFYMIIISHIKKLFRTLIFYFWSLLVTFGLVDHKTKSILSLEGYVEYIQLFMIIIIHINKWLWTWTFYFWSLLVTFRLVDDKTKSILLVEVYVDSVIYKKTKSNQKWPKVKYQGSKIFINMANNNHIK